jgi:hypothetical protein
MKAGSRALFPLLCLLACSSGGAPAPSTTSSTLAQGVAARAGDEQVSVATVARVAARQGIDPRSAVGLALSDALLAQGARAALPRASTRSIERAAAGRSVLELLGTDAAAAGPPSEAELSEIVRERWTELARPDAVRTTHAVVMNDKPERDAAAHAVADNLLLALQSVTSGEELIRVAEAFPAGGFKIVAQALPFVTVDGRTFQRHDPGFVASKGGFDLDFARAANAIDQPGRLSPIVKTAFGYHVIRLDERLTGVSVAQPELLALLGPEVQTRRAARARTELLEKLHKASAIQLDRAVDELTAHIELIEAAR